MVKSIYPFLAFLAMLFFTACSSSSSTDVEEECLDCGNSDNPENSSASTDLDDSVTVAKGPILFTEVDPLNISYKDHGSVYHLCQSHVYDIIFFHLPRRAEDDKILPTPDKRKHAISFDRDGNIMTG